MEKLRASLVAQRQQGIGFVSNSFARSGWLSAATTFAETKCHGGERVENDLGYRGGRVHRCASGAAIAGNWPRGCGAG
ncbi:hypothetical protein D9M70_646100 [compost metagenome]